jgi:energy-coupling factor transporter transmembrane protein EcfT
MAVIFTFMVAYYKNAVLPNHGGWEISFPVVFLDQLIYGLLIALFILLLTLPQATLLWTEPDIEQEAEGPGS